MGKPGTIRTFSEDVATAKPKESATHTKKIDALQKKRKKKLRHPIKKRYTHLRIAPVAGLLKSKTIENVFIRREICGQ